MTTTVHDGGHVGVRGATRDATENAQPEPQFRVRDYAVLLKPRVMSLVVFTAMVGLLLAPDPVAPWTAVIAVLCIAVGAGASGAINMWYDRDIDREMTRTRNRPIPAGRLRPIVALVFGSVLAATSIGVMSVTVNAVAGALLAVTIGYYVFIYTVWLKRRTPQNIVIGGAAGALPPMIGWAAASGDVGWGAVSLFLIIFLWTPPHSWALALFREGDYRRAGVPMMPVVAGVDATKRQILLYTGLLLPATALPVLVGMAGAVYGIAAAALAVAFAWHAVRLYRDSGVGPARPLFFFSILYLFLIFVALLADRALAPMLVG